MTDLSNIWRQNILKLKPYTSARDDFHGEAHVWLDANENPVETGLNRYPDPHQKALKQRIAELKGVQPDQIFLGNGSDEAIDLLVRAACVPGADKALLLPPTYGMYQVACNIHDVQTVEAPLDEDFQPYVEAIMPLLADPKMKLVFICSPNNPTGNLVDKDKVRAICAAAKGLVILDEAYVDLSPGGSMLPELAELPNLVILQTFSKAWGLAGLRLGMAFASPQVVEVLGKIKPPYNINILTQKTALEKLQDPQKVTDYVAEMAQERQKLTEELQQLSFVEQVYPSEANFLLVRVTEPKVTYQYLVDQGIVVRERSSAVAGCIRITIGTATENQELLQALKNYQP